MRFFLSFLFHFFRFSLVNNSSQILATTSSSFVVTRGHLFYFQHHQSHCPSSVHDFFFPSPNQGSHHWEPFPLLPLTTTATRCFWKTNWQAPFLFTSKMWRSVLSSDHTNETWHEVYHLHVLVHGSECVVGLHSNHSPSLTPPRTLWKVLSLSSYLKVPLIGLFSPLA